MSNYIVTTNNETFKFYVFNNGWWNGYINNPPADIQCVELGQNIPIYRIWEDFYFSDYDTSKHVAVYNNNYYTGMVLALTDIKQYDNRTTIGAIIIEKRTGNTTPTYAERLAERSTGQYSYSSPISVHMKYITRPNTSIDYSKFVFGTGANDNWERSGDEFSTSGYSQKDLLGVIGWSDGVCTSLGNTVLLPYIINTSGSYVFAGLCTRIFKDNKIVNVDNIVISEDSEDWCGIGRTYSAEFCYAREDFENGKYGIQFQNDFWSGYEPYIPPDYPFEDDYNEGGGGTGDYRDTSDTIPIDGTPANSAIASGFVNAYLLTQQNVNDFHNYLYSTDFLTNVKKLMNDPIDYILAFMLAPYTPDTSANANITIGGTDSGVNALRISSGYKTVDCGTITLSEFWGKFYDYNPYTKVQIYLPFIGMRPLDVDDVMAGDVNLKYRIDVLTGACVATISVNNARGTNGSIYNFNGNCHSHIPISGKNYLETVTNVLSAGVGMAGSIASGNALGVASGAINVMRSAKEQLEHAGELTGATGLLSNYIPFLMVSRPSQSLAQNYNHYKGFISNVTAQLGTLTGYTEVAELVQTNIHCTLDEFDEINDLLKSGVYL